MGLFDMFSAPDINAGVEEFKNTPDALLLDVRSVEEYAGGHVPGSKNIPIQTIMKVDEMASNKDVPLFVYCHSGARSARAVKFLEKTGYSNVKNIGGIIGYKGKIEK